MSDEALIRDLKGRHLQEPSRRILAEAIALGSRLVVARKGLVAWVAEVLFDSGLAPATAGVRNGAAASERRLLYHCTAETHGEAQVDLRLHSEADGTVKMVGQLLPPWSGGSVEAKSGRARRKAVLGVNGEFAVSRIPGGSDTIAVTISAKDGNTIVLGRVPTPARKGRPASR